ncbi:MAG: RNA-binding S4 domain-containing protein [Paludibacteraceae bacterium]|nr:RNA-binding S4 domain-containing protein [Paludibacteraceae bacterium]
MMGCRIDKWLWEVRLYKTRSLAAEACKKGQIMVDDVQAKSSREVKIGDVVSVRKAPIVYRYEVLGLPTGRIGAKLVVDYVRDVTTPEMKELLEVLKVDQANNRAKGTGRPTKKERRDLEEFFYNS